jgi:hypothetical protein
MTRYTLFSLLAIAVIGLGAHPAVAADTLRADLLGQLAPSALRPSAEAAAIGDALALRALASPPRPAVVLDAEAGPWVAVAERIRQDRS